MPRYLINVATLTVHNADCRHGLKNVVPWPRFEYDGQGTCAACLPRGFPIRPTKRTRQQVIAADDRQTQVVVRYVPPVRDDALQAAGALPADPDGTALEMPGDVSPDPHGDAGRDSGAGP